ncbi:MAG: NADH-quinone oxidoreductase subunit NuoH [Methanobacteriota archaeon]
MVDFDLREVIGDVLVWALSQVGVEIGAGSVDVLVSVVAMVVVLALTVGLAAPIMVWGMRKIMAHIQHRSGPMRVGPHGLLQPMADGIKMITKEDVIPAAADRWGFNLVPYLLFVPAVVAFAPLPFGSGLIVTNVAVGVILILALTAISPLGEIIAGWASNNKYSLYGGLRAAALDVSYEVPMLISAVAVVLLAGSMSTIDIVEAQTQAKIFGVIPRWFVFLQPIGMFIFFAAGLAKIGVVPMDLPEAESELVQGYLTEFSGMRFGLVFIPVFAGIFLISGLTVTLYFGGWSGPFLPGILWFLVKTGLFATFVFVVWFTLPRVRIDQFLGLCWKVFFPLSLVNLAIAAFFAACLGPRDCIGGLI